MLRDEIDIIFVILIIFIYGSVQASTSREITNMRLPIQVSYTKFARDRDRQLSANNDYFHYLTRDKSMPEMRAARGS
jgi:biopolymer transport protein ExbD